MINTIDVALATEPAILRKGSTAEIFDNVATLLNKEVCLIETAGNLILAGDIYTITLTSNIIFATSAILGSVTNGTNSQGLQTVLPIKANNGNAEINILNVGAQSISNDTNGTLILVILILN